MPTYILMTKLSPDAAHFKDRESAGREWIQTISRKCPEVKWISHYFLLGPYDFMDIYEAPNEEVAAKVSMITQTLGAMKAESWTAVPYHRVLELCKDL